MIAKKVGWLGAACVGVLLASSPVMGAMLHLPANGGSYGEADMIGIAYTGDDVPMQVGYVLDDTYHYYEAEGTGYGWYWPGDPSMSNGVSQGNYDGHTDPWVSTLYVPNDGQTYTVVARAKADVIWATGIQLDTYGGTWTSLTDNWGDYSLGTVHSDNAAEFKIYYLWTQRTNVQIDKVELLPQGETVSPFVLNAGTSPSIDASKLEQGLHTLKLVNSANGTVYDSVTFEVVPEPATLSLLMAGLMVGGLRRRKRA